MKKTFIYNFILSILIFFTLPLYSEESTETKDETTGKKKFGIILRRQNSILYPYESHRFQELYRTYRDDRNNTKGNFAMGFQYFFPNDYRLEYNFNEIQKAELSKFAIRCYGSSSSSCISIPYSIGSYYRIGSELNLYKDLYKDYFSIGGGIRYIQSNLSLTFPYSYHLFMGNNSAGANISLKLKTPSFYRFRIGLKIDGFYLVGKMQIENGSVSRRYLYRGNIYQNKVASINLGTETDMFLQYSITDSLIISVGGSMSKTQITPKTKFINSYDYSSDLNYNFQGSLSGRNYVDRIRSSYVQLTILF
ncbi:MAG: hypothetical protein KDK36_05425 [Leptospiraceae bacterium]|nr:hypothetical protein [Leptospiraceae bacterium]